MRRSTLLLLGVLLLHSCTAQQRLRRSMLFHHETLDEIECLYVLYDIAFEDGTSEELDACLVEDTIYTLPVGLLSKYSKEDLKSGATRITIAGARLQSGLGEANEVIVTRRTPEITLYNNDEPEYGLRTSAAIPQQQYPAMGTLKVIAVRVTSRDSNVTLSLDELEHTMLGNNNNVTLSSQLHDCSAGALTLNASVAELYIDVDTVGVASKQLENVVRNEFEAHIGAQSSFDHILFCMPQGTTASRNNWIAYAYRKTRYSYYHDKWCGSLTSKMHEVGHNWNLGHSGKRHGTDYDDRSCVMGASFPSQIKPQECFNGWRHWNLGWFAQHQVTVKPKHNGPWGGRLVAFVDYRDIAASDYAIINVRDVYLQLNLADKHNVGVGEKGNQVTGVQSGGSEERVSNMLFGLDTQNPTFVYSHEGDNIVIELCEPGTYGNSVRYYRLSIHLLGETSTCDTQAPPSSPPKEPPQPPTARPTEKPTGGGGSGCVQIRPGVTNCP